MNNIERTSLIQTVAIGGKLWVDAHAFALRYWDASGSSKSQTLEAFLAQSSGKMEEIEAAGARRLASELGEPLPAISLSYGALVLRDVRNELYQAFPSASLTDIGIDWDEPMKRFQVWCDREEGDEMWLWLLFDKTFEQINELVRMLRA